MSDQRDRTPGPSPIAWGEDGQPRSRLYGDVYFSSTDGLAESRAVFLRGCGLPEAWRGRSRFVVGELGFGTGLNIAALVELWGRTREAGARLHVFTVEAHPLAAHEAARALSAWPELADAAGALLAAWPGRARGFHRIELPRFDVILDLAVMEAAEALARWTGRADAWFLDGFAPALNPQMWRDEVLRGMAARSAPGATAATFTVAGDVRRGLAAAGFAVEKRPGFGRKRERLEARAPGVAAPEAARRSVAVVGAGIAGAAAARAVRALGCEARVFDAKGPGAGASGNPAALATPRLDAGLGLPAELFAQAFRRAGELCETHPEALIARGVLQLARTPRDADRYARIAASDLFEPGTMRLLDREAASRALGEPVPGALDQTQALVLEPAPLLQAWAGETHRVTVARLVEGGGLWRLLGADGEEVGCAEAVIVAAGPGSPDLADGLPLSFVRGQASWASGPGTIPAAAWGGYVLPIRGGVLFGATHDRDDPGLDVREEDHARNRARLAEVLPALAARLEAAPLAGRAALRATTPDRSPLAGPAPAAAPGIYVLTGFGSRGFSLAPLLAEHVAALALGAPSPLPAPLWDLVDPARFRRRAARRGYFPQGAPGV
jgi:tRNA 5-methylaminomethyl-2-thiouridine biosynthesis bifunctional protein